MGDLRHKRVLVVGASSGIGRVVARMAGEQGARVAFAARRLPLLEAAVADAGGGEAIRCDVRDPQSCAEVVRESAARLGGIDALVYATAVDPLVRISEADAGRWADTLATNVIGASLVCQAAMPHLAAVAGRVVFVSASSIGRPVPLMGVYACSKAALEELVRAWRSEHPEVSFCSARVGSTLGTGVSDSWDRELTAEMSGHYLRGGYDLDNGPGTMTVDDCAASIIAALTIPVCIREFTATAAAGAH